MDMVITSWNICVLWFHWKICIWSKSKHSADFCYDTLKALYWYYLLVWNAQILVVHTSFLETEKWWKIFSIKNGGKFFPSKTMENIFRWKMFSAKQMNSLLKIKSEDIVEYFSFDYLEQNWRFGRVCILE